ncbi:MAG: ParB N-terminal domain-containing protein [Bacteroidaceae bacterium]|nr:ParB N-terminal domain-containing protein [Bacteroidaceae bacterium]
MEIVIKKLEELTPADYNPRKDLQEADKEYQDIKSTIQMFGLVVPLIMNKRTGNLVNGHQRLKVLRDLGYKEVEVSLVDMDEKKEKALNLALSRIDGDFDNKALTNVMAEIKEAGIDPITLGFTKSEVDKMFPAEMNAENLFGDEADNPFSGEDEKPEETEVVAMVGKYRFSMEKSKMEEVMGDIRYRNGFVKEKVEKEIKLRLLYGKDWKEHTDAADDDSDAQD